MSLHLLSCDCGAKIPVSRRQAGMSIPCTSCNKLLDVPTIRDFATLPLAEPQLQSAPIIVDQKPSIALRLIAGVLFLVAAIFLGYAGMIAYDRFTFPFDLSKTDEELFEASSKAIQKFPPADTWDTWNSVSYAGLSAISTPDYFRYKRAYELSGQKMVQMLSVGGAALLAFIVCLALSIKGKKKQK